MTTVITREQGYGGFSPEIRRIVTTATLAQVTTAGWYNNAPNFGENLSKVDQILICYAYGSADQATALFSVAIGVNNIVTLSIASSGEVTLPVVSGDFAVFDGTTGTIKDAGYSATDATKTKVVMLNATPVVASRLASFSATNGTLADSGVLVSAVQLAANIKAATTANIGGAGAGPISVAVTGLTTASVVVANIATSSNATTVSKCIATNTGFNITFSADPGATCTVNYVAFIAAQ